MTLEDEILADADIEYPHYHPCGHCKRGSTGFACFDKDSDPHKHRGVYELCQDCEEALYEAEPDNGYEPIMPGDYPPV